MISVIAWLEMLNWKPLDLIDSPSLILFLLSVSEINSKSTRAFTDNDFWSNINITINLLLASFVTLLSRACNSGAHHLHHLRMVLFTESNSDGIYKPSFLLSWLIQYTLLVPYFRDVACCQAISKKCILMHLKQSIRKVVVSYTVDGSFKLF